METKLRTPTKNSSLATLAVSLVVACLLSLVRGGFATLPFSVFTGGTFVLALVGQTLFQRESLTSIETALRHLPLSAAVRYSLVCSALLALAVWSGPMITSGGFGGWLVALFLWLASPAIICLLVPRYPILFGILSTGCTVFSLAVQNSRLYSRSRDIQWEHAFSHPSTLLAIWSFAAAVSLTVSIPVYVHRQAA